MDVSVVVPTFNRKKLVTRAIEKLSMQTFPPSQYEIIVVVDGSTDGTAASLSALSLACRFSVIEQKNRGPAAARNTGYRAAETDLVLFLDDDMLPDPELVAAHVAAHKEFDRSIAFGAIFLSADSPPSLTAECFRREIGALHLERKRNPQVEWRITDCVFSNASLPRSLLEELGGFDERFRMREDLELGTRLFSAGVFPRYISNAVAYQYYEKASADLIRDAEVFAAADVMFARKYPEVLIKGQLNWLGREPRWKRRMRQMTAGAPAVADFFLAPMCGFGEAFFRVPAFRNLGVRALQMRRRIHWYRKAVELGWQSPEAKGEDTV